MATKRTILGFALEGVGYDTAQTGGLCLTWGAWTPYALTAYEWIESLVRLPGSVATEVNPYTGDWSTSAFTLEVDASDRLAQLLMSDQRRAPYAIDGAITSAATSITLTPSPGSALNDAPIWVDDETILLGTHSGGGTYTGCTRGFWGSSAAAHTDGALAFDRVPGWEGRLVTLVEQDVVSGDEVARWRGLIRDITQDGPRIAVQCEEYLAAISRAQVNRAARDLAQGQGLVWRVIGGNVYLSGAPLVGYTPTVDPDTTPTSLVNVEVDGYVSTVPRARLTGASALSIGGGGVWRFGHAPVDVTSGERFGGSVWEVLAIPGAPDPDGYLATHPLVAALMLLTSTGTGSNGAFDVLGESWGLGLTIIDAASWTAEIERSPHLAIDHLVLGAGGDPVNVLQVVQDTLLRPFGYFLAVTTTGLLSVARLRLPTIADGQDASAGGASAYPDGPLVLERGLGRQALEVVATVGGTPGTGDGREVTIKPPIARTRRVQLGDVRQTRYDLQVLSPRRISGTRRAAGALISALASLLSLGLDTVPRLRVRVADHTVTGTPAPDLGAWLALEDLGPIEDAWLVDASGARVSDTTGAAWAGMVVGRRWELTNHTYEITLLLLGWRIGQYIRERAPSAVVASVDGTDITLEDGNFAGDPDDARTFTAGDEVRFMTRDGVLIAGTYTVISTSANFIELNTTTSPEPDPGAVMRLAPSDTYDNATIYPITHRPYVYIASDTTEQIEEADASLSPPDIYGSAVFGGI